MMDQQKQLSSASEEHCLSTPEGPPEGNEKQESSRTRVIGVPKRYILLLMIFIGFVNIYAMRVNLNVALVAMVNNQTIIRRGVKMIKVC